MMLMKSFALGLVVIGLYHLELVKSGSNCDGTLDCCCLNGTATLIDDCCECVCNEPFTGEFCEIKMSVEEISKATFQDNNNPYYRFFMSSRKSNKPLRRALRKSSATLTQRPLYFDEGDTSTLASLSFVGPGKKALRYLEGQFRTAIAGSKVYIYAISDGQDTLVDTHEFMDVNKSEGFHVSFMDVNVTSVEFRFSTACTKRHCYGINRLFGEYDLEVTDPLNCATTECNGSGETAVFDNGCCTCVSV